MPSSSATNSHTASTVEANEHLVKRFVEHGYPSAVQGHPDVLHDYVHSRRREVTSGSAREREPSWRTHHLLMGASRARRTKVRSAGFLVRAMVDVLAGSGGTEAFFDPLLCEGRE